MMKNTEQILIIGKELYQNKIKALNGQVETGQSSRKQCVRAYMLYDNINVVNFAESFLCKLEK